MRLPQRLSSGSLPRRELRLADRYPRRELRLHARRRIVALGAPAPSRRPPTDSARARSCAYTASTACPRPPSRTCSSFQSPPWRPVRTIRGPARCGRTPSHQLCHPPPAAVHDRRRRERPRTLAAEPAARSRASRARPRPEGRHESEHAGSASKPPSVPRSRFLTSSRTAVRSDPAAVRSLAATGKAFALKGGCRLTDTARRQRHRPGAREGAGGRGADKDRAQEAGAQAKEKRRRPAIRREAACVTRSTAARLRPASRPAHGPGPARRVREAPRRGAGAGRTRPRAGR